LIKVQSRCEAGLAAEAVCIVLETSATRPLSCIIVPPDISAFPLRPYRGCEKREELCMVDVVTVPRAWAMLVSD
jgi:hypothetical protein